MQPLLIKLDTVTLQYLQQSKHIEVYVTCSLNTVSSINMSKLLFVLLPSLSMSNITLIKPFYRLIFFMTLRSLLEIRGFEPLTYGLQSCRSSQLSYIPDIAVGNSVFYNAHLHINNRKRKERTVS